MCTNIYAPIREHFVEGAVAPFALPSCRHKPQQLGPSHNIQIHIQELGSNVDQGVYGKS